MRLRPVRARDDAVVHRLRSEEETAPYNWFGPPQPEPAGDATVRHVLIELGEGPDGGEVVGSMSWHPVRYGPNPESACMGIGITILASHRGRGIGSVAQRLLADQLFETTSVHRVEAATDITNAAEQRSLEKAGFQRDGIVRSAQFRQGTYHDLVIYSRLRTDP